MEKVIKPGSINELLDRLKSFEEIDQVIDGLKHQLEGSGPIKKIFEDLIDNINIGGKGGSFNFYPSDTKGSCNKLCLGIATRKFGHKSMPDKNRTGFKGLMKEIIQYWFSCYEVNGTTFLMTFDWDSEAFANEWESVINSYVAKGKEVMIVDISDKPRGYIIRYPIS